MIQATSNLRCAECRREAPALDFLMRGKKCGGCGSPYQIDPDQDFIIVGQARTPEEQGGVWIRLNWAEIKILVVWARFWADKNAHEDPAQWSWMLRAIDAIAFQLKKLAPTWPLTVADEAEVSRQKAGGGPVHAVRPDGTEVQLEPAWLNRERVSCEHRAEARTKLTVDPTVAMGPGHWSGGFHCTDCGESFPWRWVAIESKEN